MNKLLFSMTMAVAILCGCSSDEEESFAAADEAVSSGGLRLTSSVTPFEGEQLTRVNLAGNGFEDNDMIKIKVICPYVTSVTSWRPCTSPLPPMRLLRRVPFSLWRTCPT
ncbi:MAG: hypothetical protein ACI4TW_05940 [Prevotella sp.]